MQDLRTAILEADPKLSKFQPLRKILFHDDFERGMSGWNTLLGNYTKSLANRHPGYLGFVPPMISNVTHWDGGSHGALSGSYALKLATRPVKGAQTVVLKRLTFQEVGALQMECWFTFKPEAVELELSDVDVRSFGFVFDFQDGQRRVLPQFRYLNAMNGERVGKWQFKQKTIPFRDVGDKTVTVYHYGEENWEDIPNGSQELCYNELPTKINWHYLSFKWDLKTMSYLELNCNGQKHDVEGLTGITVEAMPNLRNLLNVIPFVETDSDKRAFLYLDSVLLSAERP